MFGGNRSLPPATGAGRGRDWQLKCGCIKENCFPSWSNIPAKCALSPPGKSSGLHGHHLGVLQVSSILTLTLWGQHRPYGQKLGPTRRLPSTSDASHREWVPSYSHFCLSQLQIRGFHNPLLRLNDLLEWLPELREHFAYVYWFI